MNEGTHGLRVRTVNILNEIAARENIHDSHAQAEIQEYGRAIKSICVELFPWTMELYETVKFKIAE